MFSIDFSTIKPTAVRPIYVVGAGSIVNDAHLPAYASAGFPVAGIFDPRRDKSETTAERFSIPRVFESLTEMTSHAASDAVFDIAVPGDALPEVLKAIPDGSAVLMQKPMGNNLAQAREVLRIAGEKKLIAAVNFQLRYAPFINGLRDLMKKGVLGEIYDVEVNVNVFTPWKTWDFLYTLPRVEILYHSIHYIDLMRSLLGEPRAIQAKSFRHPLMPELASVRSSIVMDYGDMLRASIHTNHANDFGPDQQDAYIKVEGTGGAVKIRLGVLMDYPKGVPDVFSYCIKTQGVMPVWHTADPGGTWFPDAFVGSMAQVMCAASGEIEKPDNSVEDVINTMICVETAYLSHEKGGIHPEMLK